MLGAIEARNKRTIRKSVVVEEIAHWLTANVGLGIDDPPLPNCATFFRMSQHNGKFAALENKCSFAHDIFDAAICARP
jgi:hypothetical protein